jgi:hypothetical protein
MTEDPRYQSDPVTGARVMIDPGFSRRFGQIARQLGWRASHTRTSRNASGRRSAAIEGDVGAPDWLLAKDGVVLLVELKRVGGRRSLPQEVWAKHLPEGVYRLWTPADIDKIVVALGGSPLLERSSSPRPGPGSLPGTQSDT